MRKTKKSLISIFTFIAAIFVTASIVLVYIFWNPLVGEYLNRKEFSSSQWKDEKLVKNEVRITMVDNLLEKYRLVGKTKEEINELLGVPPTSNRFKEYDYVYWLGAERGLTPIDSEWLVIKFDKNIVSNVNIVRD